MMKKMKKNFIFTFVTSIHIYIIDKKTKHIKQYFDVTNDNQTRFIHITRDMYLMCT